MHNVIIYEHLRLFLFLMLINNSAMHIFLYTSSYIFQIVSVGSLRIELVDKRL